MATLQPQQVAVKFAGGVETKQDPKAVPSAKLLALENGVFTKAISIKKRNGYGAYAKTIEDSTGGLAEEITDARRLGTRDNELLAFTKSRCYSRQTSTDQWSDAGQVYSTHATDRPLVHTGTEMSTPDHATNNGVSVVAWEDSRGGVYFTVVDSSSGRVYVEARAASATGSRPRCVAAGPNLHLYYAEQALGRVMIHVINPENPAVVTTAAILVDDLNANHVYDACPTTRTGTPAAIVWHERATTNFRLGYVDSSGVLGSPATGHPSVYRQSASMQALRSDTPIAVAYKYVDGGATDVLAVAAVNTRVASTCAAYNFSGGSTSVPIGDTAAVELWLETAAVETTITQCTVAITDTKIWGVYVNLPTASVSYSDHFAIIRSQLLTETATSAVAIDSYVQRSVVLRSRAFVVDDEVFAYFMHVTTYFNTYFALRVSSGILDNDNNYRLACVARQTAGGASLPSGNLEAHLASAHVDTTVVSACLTYKTRLESEDNDKFGESGVRLYTLDFDNASSHQSGQIGRGLYLASGCPQHYDGRRWMEQGFNVGPENINNIAVTSNTDGGGLTAAGVYKYVAWYEATDTQGEVHRGPVSIGTSVTMGDDGGEVPVSDDTVTLQIPTCRITTRERVRVCVGRSLNGDTSRLFRVTSLDPTTEGDDNGYLANDVSVDYVTFVDVMSDADLAKQEPVYTNGGILSNDPTALGSVLAVGKNRVFFSDASDQDLVRFSQPLAEGYGLECAPELFQRLDPFGGALTGLCVMDDFVIAFKESAIYSFNGAGPLPNGDIVNSGFGNPELLTSDVGCTEPSSIVLSPVGIMFKSTKGIYLLDRARSIQYIGAAAETYNDQTVRRATVMPDRSQVVFLTDSGKSLLFDFLFAQWSTFTNHEGKDSVVVGGVYNYLRNDDRVFYETPGVYSDAGVRITLRFETSWIHIWEHLQGLQRFWKLLLLGTWGSPHQLGIQYSTDYMDGAWSDPFWLDATDDTSSTGWITGENANTIGEDPIGGDSYGDGLYGGGVYGGEAPGIYQWRLGIHESGQSIKFRFEDFEKAGIAGATFELTEMLITGGVMKPDNRPFPAARST